MINNRLNNFFLKFIKLVMGFKKLCLIYKLNKSSLVKNIRGCQDINQIRLKFNSDEKNRDCRL